MDATLTLRFPPLARFRFSLLALDRIHLPEYAGSAWRGALGHGLRRTACVTRQPTCDGCLLLRTCAYSTLFETPPSPGQTGYSPPHPFVLALDPTAPREHAPGAPLEVSIHLIGSAIAQAPYFVHAFVRAGQRGLGRDQARFALHAVAHECHPGQADWVTVYREPEGGYTAPTIAPLQPPPAPTTLRMRFVTPVRIKRDGHFLGARDLTATDFVQALYRRLRALAGQYGETPDAAKSFDLPAARLQAGDLTLRTEGLRWQEWTRYSSRQDSLMQFGGLTGALRLDGPTLGALWPALWLGQWTHVGKGTAFGLGAYRIEPRSTSLPSTDASGAAPAGDP